MTCQLPMTLELTRKNGADPERFLLRFAGKEDIAGIQKLQDAVYDALPDKSIFMKDTEEEISTSIDLDWCLVTEAADGRLADGNPQIVFPEICAEPLGKGGAHIEIDGHIVISGAAGDGQIIFTVRHGFTSVCSPGRMCQTSFFRISFMIQYFEMKEQLRHT